MITQKQLLSGGSSDMIFPDTTKYAYFYKYNSKLIIAVYDSSVSASSTTNTRIEMPSSSGVIETGADFFDEYLKLYRVYNASTVYDSINIQIIKDCFLLNHSYCGHSTGNYWHTPFFIPATSLNDNATLQVNAASTSYDGITPNNSLACPIFGMTPFKAGTVIKVNTGQALASSGTPGTTGLVLYGTI